MLSDTLAVERLWQGDAAGALALSDAAGWNQTADDWAFFFERAQVLGCRDGAGRLVASAAALPYGWPRADDMRRPPAAGIEPGGYATGREFGVGWVSMVLVAEAFRHRGLASRLLGGCVEALQQAGRIAVLDATPAGREVYQRSGFVAGFGFERWEGQASGEAGGEAPRHAGPTREAEHDLVAALDEAAMRMPRAALWRSFLGRAGTRVLLTPERNGFAVARAGRRATQIGPLVADTEAEAISLLAEALAACSGRVFIDVPVCRRAFAEWLTRRGFVRQRPFTRMALGTTPVLQASETVFALAGPEFG